MNVRPPDASAPGGDDKKTQDQEDFESLVDEAFRRHYERREMKERIALARIQMMTRRRDVA